MFKTNAAKTSRIITILAYNKWGAENKICLIVYKVLIKIDYSSIIYGSVRIRS